MGKIAFDIVGVIDVGSHNLHLTIAQVDKDGSITVLEDLVKPTTIGSDAFTLGRIQVSTIRDMVETLKGFVLVLKDYKVKTYKAIGTSALRDAENREYVLEHIRLRTGISVEVINSAQERFYMYKALRYQSPELEVTNSEESTLVVNIGLGGVEISIYDKGSLRLTEYIKIGALRLYETFAELRNKTTDFTGVMEEFVNSKISPLKPIINSANIKYFIGLGSEINTIFHIYPQNQESVINKEDITNLYEKIQGMPDDQMMETFHLTARQVETFLPSIIVLNSLIKITKTKRIYVPMVVLRHGMIHDLADQIYDSPRREESLKDIISSVWYIAKKYKVDKEHAAQVEKLALEIFDQTIKLHKMGERERLYLQISAILHAIGYFVNFSEHTILSFELIKKQNIMGLTNNELDIIANIVRYHKTEVPSQFHPNYQSLSHEERITVSKLAAIFKLADSLDLSRGKKIEEVEIVFTGEELYFKLSTKYSTLLEEWEFAKGALFFEEIMGVRPHTKHQGLRSGCDKVL